MKNNMRSVNEPNNRVIKNMGWLMAQQIYSMILALVIGSLSARYLGPQNYGLINYTAAIIAFFLPITQLGFDRVIINEMLKTPEKQGEYLGSAFIARLCLSAFSIFLIILICAIFEPSNNELRLIALFQAMGLVFQSSELFNSWFQMTLKMKFVSIASMIALTVTGAWRVTLLALGASVHLFALSSSIQYFVCAMVVFPVFLKMSSLRLRFRFATLKKLLSQSHHLIISGIAVVIYNQVDRLMIGKMMGTREVGIYSAAAMLSSMWMFVPIALINSMSPLILKAKQEDCIQFNQKLTKMIIYVSLLSVMAGVFFTLFGKLIISLLYGAEFFEALTPLIILVWTSGLSVMGVARSVWLVANNLVRYTKYFTIIGGVVNLILNFYSIPHHGITGAAFTTLISEIAVLIIVPTVFRETRTFIPLCLNSYKNGVAIVKSDIRRLISNG